jgi:chemotaxis protein methyltransferase CheR
MPLVKWKNHNIKDVEVDLLLAALNLRYGYDFTGYARASLKRRLEELKRYYGVRHLSELIPVVLYDEAVAQTAINSISVPTSEFFRDPHVWKQVREILLPQLDSFPWINIWQVGCGHGEETYTLAILLHEADLLRKARIYSSDINPAFLKDAERGRWPSRNLDAWRDNYRSAGGVGDFDAYFSLQGDDITIAPHLKQANAFVQHNLVVDQVFKEMQWVVCRNVLIYFGDTLQERVVNLLSLSLERGGYLLLGRAEKVYDLSPRHPDLEDWGQSLQAYRKKVEHRRHV